jgi:beta-lactamase class A
MTVESKLNDAFASAGVDGFVHARNIEGDEELGLSPDRAVVTASVFKIAVALELARQAAKGELDLTERVKVSSDDRILGPTGLSGMLDDAELSLRDLAYLMITISDNTATDVIMKKIGLDRINQTLEGLGLTKTSLVGDCRHILDSLVKDLGFEPDEPWPPFVEIDPELYSKCQSLQAEETSRTTPREMTQLLKMIWLNEAGPPEACAEVRRLMAEQFENHRFATAFPQEVLLSAKTGTLPGIRNEAGVIEYPDGRRYAVAVFTVAHSYEGRLAAADAVIGTAARIAVENLKSNS